MKKFLLLLVMILICLSSLPVFAGEPVTINFWHAMHGSRGKTLEKLVEDFNKSHPDIKVISTFKGITDTAKDRYKNSYNILFQQLLINISTQTPPDVSQVYENWTTQFVQIKAIVPLDTIIDKDYSEKELPDFVPTFLDANKRDGKLWALPFNKSIYVLYYNKDLFSELKLKPPTNWEEMKEVSKKLTKTDGSGKTTRYGLSFKADVDTFSVILLSSGGKLLDDDKRALFNSEDGQKTINYLKSLLANGSAQASFDPRKDFIEGKCAMFLDTSSRISDLDGKVHFNYGVSACPSDKGKILFAGTNLAIYSKSSPEKQKASWEFIKWLTNKENTAKWSMDTGYLPVRKSAIQSKEYQDFLQKNDKHQIAVEELNDAIVAPTVSSWQSIRGIIDDGVFNAVVVKQDVKETLDTAAATVDKFLVVPKQPK